MERIPLFKILNINHVPKGAFILGSIRPGKQSSESYCKIISEIGETHTMGVNDSVALGQEVKLIGYAIIKSKKQ